MGGWRPVGWALLLILGANGVLGAANAGATQSAEPTVETVPEDSRVKCYACGLSEVDPTSDNEGYCDQEKDGQNCAANSKMYNHTCDIMDRLEKEGGDMSHWTRTCPEGVKSCFYAETSYEKQTPVFRGCASAKYPHDPKCDRELQAVQVVAGKKSEDVEVLLCYCNESAEGGEVCNMKIVSGASANIPLVATLGTTLLAALLR